MNHMVSQFQSQYLFASHRGLQSESQLHRITNLPNSPTTSINFQIKLPLSANIYGRSLCWHCCHWKPKCKKQDEDAGRWPEEEEEEEEGEEPSLLAQQRERGDFAKAMFNVDRMISKARSCDVENYNIFIDELCKKGQFERAIQHVTDMISEGLQPDLAVYTIIRGLCEKGESDYAVDLLEDILSKGFEPHSMTYAMILSGFTENKELKEALMKILHDDMISKGHDPDDGISNGGKEGRV